LLVASLGRSLVGWLVGYWDVCSLECGLFGWFLGWVICFVGWLVYRLIGCLVGWLIRQSVLWLVCSSVGWLADR